MDENIKTIPTVPTSNAEQKPSPAFDPRDVNFADKIYEYYQHLDWSDFEKKCDEDLEEILTEYTYGVKKVKELLNS